MLFFLINFILTSYLSHSETITVEGFSHCAKTHKTTVQISPACKNIHHLNVKKNKGLRIYKKSLQRVCLSQRSLARKYLNVQQAQECKQPFAVMSAAQSIDQAVSHIRHYSNRATQAILDYNLSQNGDLKVPPPPPSAMIYTTNYASRMKEAIIDDVSAHLKKKIEIFKPIKNSKNINKKLINNKQCSTSGFLKTGIKNYEYECRSPKKIHLINVRGNRVSFSCAPKTAYVSGMGTLPDTAFDEAHMCNPLLFGYMPLSSSGKESTKDRGRPICGFPQDTGNQYKRRPHSMNMWCSRISGHINNVLPSSLGSDAVMLQISMLHKNNPQESYDILQGSKNHCLNLDSNTAISAAIRKHEKESCVSLMKRILLIESWLTRYQNKPKALDPAIRTIDQ